MIKEREGFAAYIAGTDEADGGPALVKAVATAVLTFGYACLEAYRERTTLIKYGK